MIRVLLSGTLALIVSQTSWSDSIANYQRISKSIPKMEIKADEQSQAWARSARHVLNITNESIAETLIAMNEEATKNGRPFFCLPKDQPLNAERLAQLIDEQNLPSASNKMTVSQIALEAVKKKYPCRSSSQNAYSSLSQTHAAMQHGEATP